VLRTPPPPPPRPQALARALDNVYGHARARFKYAALFADDRDFSQNQFAEEFRAQESCAPTQPGRPAPRRRRGLATRPLLRGRLTSRCASFIRTKCPNPGAGAQAVAFGQF